MSLSRKIADALDAPANPESSARPVDLTATEGDHHLRVHVLDAGPVGVSFDSLSFTATNVAEPTIEALKAWGERLAARVTYLMEPLALIEADPIAREVRLRSTPPTSRGDVRSYYEVHIRGADVNMNRFAFDETARSARKVVPCQLTREAIERLADDLAAVAP